MSDEPKFLMNLFFCRYGATATLNQRIGNA